LFDYLIVVSIESDQLVGVQLIGGCLMTFVLVFLLLFLFVIG